MTKSNRFFVLFFCAGLATAYLPESHADLYEDKAQSTEALATVQSLPPCSYGQMIGDKALRMLSNLTLGALEVPKNMIIVSNEGNVFYGLTGGFIKGVVDTLGRTAIGITELVSLPIPTKAAIRPPLPWQDFNSNTTYGPVFQPDSCPPEQDTVVATPVPVPTYVPRPVAPAPVPPRQDNYGKGSPYQQEINRKLDSIVKQQMQK